ncbi:hypothetical protein WJX72_001409 [[Myrmecia] bisecta]|uniref:V-type proton ATPase subunit C n=1 Tax=[Myrmecia] bisecta TaxID=41462 RepID=A0AAW1Q3F3_9CHLO
MVYWLASLPLVDGSVERTWTTLQNKTTYEADLSLNYRFELPDLRVGTLDTLMVLSDDLVKVNSMMEAVVNKIRRQLFDMQTAGGSGEEREEVLVEGISPDAYIERFEWHDAKYPPRRPLAETVQAITETVQKLEDDLKVRVSEYNQLKGQLSAHARKQTGSLAVRDLTGIVKERDVVQTENLTTLFVVVSKHTKNEWLSGYEALSDFVVPRSSKLVFEDNDYSLFTVVLFRRIADTFKSAARAKGFQVREYEFSADSQQASQAQIQKLRQDVETKRSQLEQWSSTAYGEAFSAWIHICAIRLFVESILRYGLPPQFLGVLIKPNPKTTTKLRKQLTSMFGTAGSNKYFDGEGGGSANTAAVAGAESDMYPYVSMTVSIDG